jgi:hypothetical protein
MKKFLISAILIAFIATPIYSQEPVKAFGDITFGMTKREVSKTVRANRDGHELYINDWEFGPLVPHSVYEGENKGLTGLVLSAFPKPFVQNLGKKNAEILLMDIKKTFLGAGYELVTEHTYFPNPLLLCRKEPGLIFINDSKEQYVEVTVPSKMSFQHVGDTYSIHINIFWTKYVADLMDKKDDSLQESAKKVDELL